MLKDPAIKGRAMVSIFFLVFIAAEEVIILVLKSGFRSEVHAFVKHGPSGHVQLRADDARQSRRDQHLDFPAPLHFTSSTMHGKRPPKGRNGVVEGSKR